MKVKLAKTAGFCFGVRNAIKTARRVREENPNAAVYTYGPLIHNNHVLAEMEGDGIHVLKTDGSELPKAGDKVIIRAHGVGKAVYESLEETGAELIDATCPFVLKIHKIAEGLLPEQTLLVLGDEAHPEVEGIIGWCAGDYVVIAEPEEVSMETLSPNKEYVLVSQTTFSQEKAKKIIDKLLQLGYNLHKCDTICSATQAHQAEAVTLASQVDVMLVVGARQSSNTRKLYELCKERCPRTYLVEDASQIILQGVNPEDDGVCGVTAGASTPDYIIQEVVSTMSEANVFEEMLNESMPSVYNGSIVQGTVVRVTETELILNIGCKCDGIINKANYGGTDAPLTEQVKVGDTIEAQVVKKGDSEILLSRSRLLQNRTRTEMNDALENGTILSGKVVEVVPDKGLVVEYKDTQVFIPASCVDTRRVEDLSVFMGQEVEFKLMESKKGRGRFLGDRRNVVRETRAAARKATMDQISEGAVFIGIVRSVVPYGAYVDLGGVDGLLHISEMGWKNLRHPTQYVKVGDEVRVYVKAFNAETGKISLSMRFPEENPWNGAEERFAVGNIVKGKVVRFASFGAFVELDKDIDGLIHISHLSSKFTQNPAEVLTIGQDIEAEVIELDVENQRISLSLRNLEEPEEEAAPAEEAPAEETAAE